MTPFLNTPPRPCLFRSFSLPHDMNFSKRASFSNVFSWGWCLKKLCQHIFHKITTPPRLLPVGRVPGLPIRDCAGSPSNLAPRCPRLSAIHVIAKVICERLVLVPGLCRFALFVTIPYAPTPPLSAALTATNLDLREFVFHEWARAGRPHQGRGISRGTFCDY